MAGNIQKRGERCYLIRVTLGQDEGGKRIVHTKTIHGTKREAEQYLHGVLREKDMGRFAEPTKLRLGEYLDQWLQQAAKPKVRERTFNDYSDIVEKRIKPRLGGVALEKLTPLAVQSFYNELAETYSAKSVRNAHVVLHSALKHAVRWRMLPYNPAADPELPPQTSGQGGDALDSEQARQFIDAAMQEARGLIYLVALATGMRPQEYLALQWPDINLETGAVRVQRTMYWPRGGGWRFEDMKTAKSRRSVILPRNLLPLLRTHKARQAEERLQLGGLYENNGLVFANEWGRPLEKCNLNKRTFKKILAAAGLPETLRPYDLRHTCATLLLEKGKSPKIVSERLGHASTVMTMDVYSHVTPTMQQDAADALDGLFAGDRS